MVRTGRDEGEEEKRTRGLAKGIDIEGVREEHERL
jgi:hypothetical protein